MVSQAWTSAVIYPSGNAYQSIKIAAAGIKVSFPPGAVTQPTEVWLVAAPGDLLVYELYPHGTTFKVPIKIQQDRLVPPRITMRR